MAFDKADEVFEFAQAPLSAHHVFLVDCKGADEASMCCEKDHTQRGRQACREPYREEEEFGAVMVGGGGPAPGRGGAVTAKSSRRRFLQVYFRSRERASSRGSGPTQYGIW
jgi:hypothetical protein